MENTAEKPRQETAREEINAVEMRLQSRSENVALARLMAAAMVADRDMTLAELDEIKVAVSEAVSNAIIHGYENKPGCWVKIRFALYSDALTVTVRDDGVGIEDVAAAMRPHFTMSKDHMGLGFAFMHSFMDNVEVESIPGEGTTVILTKRLRQL